MYDLSIESKEYLWFITTRTLNERLWFVNNDKLEYYILAFLAKYKKLYNVRIYAFCLMGNHYHLLASFPESNRAAFVRSFNSIIAKLVASFVPNYPGGTLWGRRAKVQAVPQTECSLETFLYTALNPTSTGLVADPKDYPGYNSFQDAINNNVRKFKLLNRSAFYRRKQYDSTVRKEEFIENYELNFDKLPFLSKKTDSENKKILLEAFSSKRIFYLQEKKKLGLEFPSKEVLLRVEMGAKPFKSKKSDRNSKRPLILSKCLETKRIFLEWYFEVTSLFRKAVENVKKGVGSVIFPSGTYKPCFFNI